MENKKKIPAIFFVVIALFIVCAGLLFIPVGKRDTANVVGEGYINFYETINYGGYGRVCAGNLIAIIFFAHAFLSVIAVMIIHAVAPNDYTGLKTFIIILAALLLITAAVLFGCSLVLFRDEVNVPGCSVTSTYLSTTQAGAIISACFTGVTGFIMFGLISAILPKKQL